MIEQLLAEFWGQVGFSVVEEGSDVVLQSPFAAALVIEEVQAALVQHDVARLKIAVHEVVVRSGEQKFCEPRKIVFEGLLAERNSRQPQEIVFEIVQVPGDRLAVKTSAWITNLVVKVAAGFNLKAGQNGERLPVIFDCGCADGRSGTIVGKKFEQRCIAKVLLDICALA